MVSGGTDEVVVPGKRIRDGVIVVTDPMAIQGLIDQLSDGDGRWAWVWGGGGGGGGGDLGDNTPGYPVEHEKGLGLKEYQEAWQKVLSEMSAAELNAFSAALAKAAADALKMKEKDVSARLAQLAAAVLVGDSIGAGFASNQASDNLRGKSMALFEGSVTKSYATAAALPGGI